jgi:hypothetical protein
MRNSVLNAAQKSAVRNSLILTFFNNLKFLPKKKIQTGLAIVWVFLLVELPAAGGTVPPCLPLAGVNSTYLEKKTE